MIVVALSPLPTVGNGCPITPVLDKSTPPLKGHGAKIIIRTTVRAPRREAFGVERSNGK